MQQNTYACESLSSPVKRLALKLLLLTWDQALVQAYVRIRPSTISASPFGFKLYRAETLASKVMIRANSHICNIRTESPGSEAPKEGMSLIARVTSFGVLWSVPKA